MEPLEAKELKAKALKNIERVALSKEESEKVAGWLKQLHESSKGFLNLTKSELVNFLIRNHKSELNPKELHQLKVDNYNPIRHLSWITPRLKEALLNKDHQLVAALQNELRSIELSVIESVTNSESIQPSSERRKNSKKNKHKPVSEEDLQSNGVRFEDSNGKISMTLDGED